MPETKKTLTARALRAAIGKSRAYAIGWLIDGDDAVLQACRDFDSAWAAARQGRK